MKREVMVTITHKIARFRWLLSLVVAIVSLAILAGGPKTAEAALVFTTERILDGRISLSGTGSVGGTDGPYGSLIFDGIVTSGSGNANEQTGGTFDFGTNFPSGLIAFDGQLSAPGTGFEYTDGDTPSGRSEYALTGGLAFASVGSTGNVLATPVGGSFPDQRVVGTWEMVNPVPIPGAVWLLGSGLVGLIGIRRKLKK